MHGARRMAIFIAIRLAPFHILLSEIVCIDFALDASFIHNHINAY